MMEMISQWFRLLGQTLSSVNAVSMLVRLGLAAVLSGIVGMEREIKQRAAGFRTHILVCTASALVMLTNLYVFENIASGGGDPVRMAAQVISGIGFLGAGTIMVTGRNQHVRGLTTAASLWAVACIGLAAGCGFYWGAIVATALIYAVMAFLPAIERKLHKPIRTLNLYLELGDVSAMREIIRQSQESGYHITSMDMSKGKTNKNRGTAVLLTLEAEGNSGDDGDFMCRIEQVEGVLFAAALDGPQ